MANVNRWTFLGGVAVAYALPLGGAFAKDQTSSPRHGHLVCLRQDHEEDR
ncbi:hypothetical protein [Saccharothrix stipae]